MSAHSAKGAALLKPPYIAELLICLDSRSPKLHLQTTTSAEINSAEINLDDCVC
jgi:hypothetical protein